MSEMVRKAIAFAMDKHSGQVRGGSKLPYVVHVIGVYSTVKKYKESKKNDVIQCAALLHDTLEDTNATFEELTKEFGAQTASIVLELTDDLVLIKQLGKEEYQKKKMCGISSYALTIKFADFLDNTSDRPTPNMIARIKNVCLHVEAHRELSGTQKLILAEVYRVIKEYEEK
jgi:(p)ppGpp synthase/HD superfamily hydrolase